MIKKMLGLSVAFFLATSLANAQNRWPKPYEVNESKPVFLDRDEKIQLTFGEKAFVVRGKIINKNKELLANDEVKKVYFTDGNGNVLKTIDVFPPDCDGRFDSSVETISKKYLVIRREYTKKNRTVNDFLVLDNAGNVVSNPEVTENMNNIFLDDEHDRIVSLNGAEGMLYEYSIQGTLLFKQSFSTQNEKEFLIKHPPEEEDERGPLECFFADSSTGEFVAYARNSGVIKNFENEFFLYDIVKNEKIFFNKTAQPLEFIPLLVFEKSERVVAVESNGGQRKYVGFDFAGKKIWELNFDLYYVNINNVTDDSVEVNNYKKDGDFEPLKEKLLLNVINGKFGK